MYSLCLFLTIYTLPVSSLSCHAISFLQIFLDLPNTNHFFYKLPQTVAYTYIQNSACFVQQFSLYSFAAQLLFVLQIHSSPLSTLSSALMAAPSVSCKQGGKRKRREIFILPVPSMERGHFSLPASLDVRSLLLSRQFLPQDYVLPEIASSFPLQSWVTHPEISLYQAHCFLKSRFVN